MAGTALWTPDTSSSACNLQCSFILRSLQTSRSGPAIASWQELLHNFAAKEQLSLCISKMHHLRAVVQCMRQQNAAKNQRTVSEFPAESADVRCLGKAFLSATTCSCCMHAAFTGTGTCLVVCNTDMVEIEDHSTVIHACMPIWAFREAVTLTIPEGCQQLQNIAGAGIGTSKTLPLIRWMAMALSVAM